MESDLSALVRRVEKLERQNRRLKLLGAGVLLLAGSVLVMGQAPSNRTIVASKILLEDSVGRVRARLGMDASDRPTLTLLNEKGMPVSALTGGSDPFLVLNKNATGEEIMVGANQAFYGVGIYDAKVVRAGLAVMKGVPGLDLFDENGKRRAGLTVASSGPSFNLIDSNEKAGFTLWVAPSGGPDFSMYDASGRLGVDIVATSYGPSMKLQDRDGFSTIIGSADLLTPTTGRKESTSAASMNLFGKDGKVLWSAP